MTAVLPKPVDGATPARGRFSVRGILNSQLVGATLLAVVIVIAWEESGSFCSFASFSSLIWLFARGLVQAGALALGIGEARYGCISFQVLSRGGVRRGARSTLRLLARQQIIVAQKTAFLPYGRFALLIQ